MYHKPIQSPKAPLNGKRGMLMNNQIDLFDPTEFENEKRPVPDFTELELFINR